jgi:hypothetical protein
MHYDDRPRERVELAYHTTEQPSGPVARGKKKSTGAEAPVLSV